MTSLRIIVYQSLTQGPMSCLPALGMATGWANAVSSLAVPSSPLVASGLGSTPPLIGRSSVPFLAPSVVAPSATMASSSTMSGSSTYATGAIVVVVVVVVVVVTSAPSTPLTILADTPPGATVTATASGSSVTVVMCVSFKLFKRNKRK